MASSKMAATAAKSKVEETNIIELWEAWRAASAAFRIAQTNLRAADKAHRDRPFVVVGHYNQITTSGTRKTEYRAETFDMIDDGILFLRQFAGADTVDWADRAEKATAELTTLQTQHQERCHAAGIPGVELIFEEAMGQTCEARKRIVDHNSRGMLAVAAKLHVAWFGSQAVGFGSGRQYPETCVRDALIGLLHLLPDKMAKVITADLRKRENA